METTPKNQDGAQERGVEYSIASIPYPKVREIVSSLAALGNFRRVPHPQPSNGREAKPYGFRRLDCNLRPQIARLRPAVCMLSGDRR